MGFYQRQKGQKCWHNRFEKFWRSIHTKIVVVDWAGEGGGCCLLSANAFLCCRQILWYTPLVQPLSDGPLCLYVLHSLFGHMCKLNALPVIRFLRNGVSILANKYPLWDSSKSMPSPWDVTLNRTL